VGAVVLSFLVWTQDTGGATIPGVPRPFLEVVLALLITVALELAVVVLGARLLYGIANVAFRRLAALGLGRAFESNPTLRTRVHDGFG